MKRKWPEWTEKNTIHLKTIVEGYAVGRIHSMEWNQFEFGNTFLPTLQSLASVLKQRFGDDEVPELTLEEVSNLYDEVFKNALESIEGFEETWSGIRSRALRHIRDDIRDAKEFELWFRKIYTSSPI